MFLALKDQLNFHQGDKELYTLLHGRSKLLTDYSYFIENQREEGDTFTGFEDVSSVYTNHKYDSPVATWAHTPGEKITILYPPFAHPSFMAEKYFPPFAKLTKEFPDLIIRHEPHQKAFPEIKDSISLFDQFKSGGPLPQVLILSPFSPFPSLEPQYIDILNEASGDCYEKITQIQFHIHSLHKYSYRTVLRMIPYKRCRSRLIKKGYYRNNKSLGIQADFERAF